MLASGRYAMLDDGMGFSLVPWKPVIEQRLRQQYRAPKYRSLHAFFDLIGAGTPYCTPVERLTTCPGVRVSLPTFRPDWRGL